MMGVEADVPDWLVWPGLVLTRRRRGRLRHDDRRRWRLRARAAAALLYPDDPPELLTSISLAVVFFNVLSGSAAYARQKRVDFVAGNVFALASIPGAIAGALVVGYVPREHFDVHLRRHAAGCVELPDRCGRRRG